MVSDCCVKGFYHTGHAVGLETKLCGLDTYVTGPKDSKKAVLIITDVHGYKFNNTRVLADKYASEVCARVYVPDLFEGDYAPADPVEKEKWDVRKFQERHPIRDEHTFQIVEKVAKELKNKHRKLAVIGFCWGAPATLFLGKIEIADCIALAHPTETTENDYEIIMKPLLLLCAENDKLFPKDMRIKSEEALFKAAARGVWSKINLYPGTVHGFALRGDEKDEFTAAAMDDARESAVSHFNRFLA